MATNRGDRIILRRPLRTFVRRGLLATETDVRDGWLGVSTRHTVSEESRQ